MENEITYQKVCQVIGNLVWTHITQLEGKDKQYGELINQLKEENLRLNEDIGANAPTPLNSPVSP